MKVCMIGSTGLTGTAVLEILERSSEVTEIISYTRRNLTSNSTKVKNVSIDFEQLLEQQPPEDAAFICCLGSTINQAGSDEAFYHIDHDLVVSFAQLAKKRRARSFTVISSVGADANSRALYLRTKGLMEKDVASLGLPQVHIFRPSMLLGHRKEVRPAELAGKFLMKMSKPLFAGPIKKYRPIDCHDLAQVMVTAALGNTTGTHIIESFAP